MAWRTTPGEEIEKESSIPFTRSAVFQSGITGSGGYGAFNLGFDLIA